MSLSRSVILKILQLAVVCTLIGLHYHTFSDKDLISMMLVMGTFGGYLIILAGVFVGIFMGSAMDRRLDIFFSAVGCILFVIAGALIIDHFKGFHRSSTRDTGLAKGSISLIEGVLFLVDAILVLRGEA